MSQKKSTDEADASKEDRLKGPFHIIVTKCGYVESGQVATMTWTTGNAYGSPLEAMKSLSNALLKKYYDDEQPERFDGKDFMDWVTGLTFRDADGWGEDLDEWWPWNSLAEISRFDRQHFIIAEEYFESFAYALIDTTIMGDRDAVYTSASRVNDEIDPPEFRVENDYVTAVRVF